MSAKAALLLALATAPLYAAGSALAAPVAAGYDLRCSSATAALWNGAHAGARPRIPIAMRATLRPGAGPRPSQSFRLGPGTLRRRWREPPRAAGLATDGPSGTATYHLRVLLIELTRTVAGRLLLFSDVRATAARLPSPGPVRPTPRDDPADDPGPRTTDGAAAPTFRPHGPATGLPVVPVLGKEISRNGAE